VPTTSTKPIETTSTTGPTSPANQIVISGKKIWEHGANPEAQRPASIILYVLADGAMILQKQISAAEEWSWLLRMDRYAPDGHEIVYTVDEAPVEGYRRAVNGYNIYNQYVPSAPTGDGNDTTGPSRQGKPDDSAQTGDTGNPMRWVLLMLASLMGFAAAMFIENPKRFMRLFTRRSARAK